MSRCLVVAVLASSALAACATAPQTPAQTIYALEGEYAAALSVAAAYHDLPACPGPVICRDPSTMLKVQVAAVVANKALTAAEDIVRGKSIGDSVAAVSNALLAIDNLRMAVSPLKVK